MLNSVLVTFSIITGLWFFVVLLYKFGISKILKKHVYKKIKRNKNKRIIKGTTVFLGSSMAIVFSIWMLFNLSGSIILHTLNANIYKKDVQMKAFQKKGAIPNDFVNNLITLEKYKNIELKVNDASGSELKYYGYQIKNAVNTKIEKVVIIHHGIWGARYQSFPYINVLKEIPYLSSNTLFVSYDSLGWHDGKKRGEGEPTFGVKEAQDLFIVIKHIEKTFNPKEIITYGFSLGGGTIYNMLRLYKKEIENDPKLTRFIIDSGYYNLEQQLVFYANHLLGFNIGSFIMPAVTWLYGLDIKTKFKFDAYDAVANMNIKLMLLHSITDKTVSSEFTCNMHKERIKQGLGNKTKTWLTKKSQNIDHVDLHLNIKTKKTYLDKMKEFFNDKFDVTGLNGCK